MKQQESYKVYVPCFKCGKMIKDYAAKIGFLDENAEFLCDKCYRKLTQKKESK